MTLCEVNMFNNSGVLVSKQHWVRCNDAKSILLLIEVAARLQLDARGRLSSVAHWLMVSIT